jgi:beta-N-acetylhexosaminidase
MRFVPAVMLLAALLAITPAMAKSTTPNSPAPGDMSQAEPADADLQAVLATMSVEEKVSQLIMSYPPLDKTAAVTVGAVVLTKDLLKHVDAVRTRVTDLQSRARIPLLVAVDQEGGKLNRLKILKGYEKVPSAEELGQGDEATARAWGRKSGQAMRGLGLNCDLAPVLDVADTGVMKDWNRSFSGDPDVVAKIGSAYARGLWEAGVVPIAKHYPGYGALEKNTDFHAVIAERTPEEMAAQLKPFTEARPFLAGVLMANVAYRPYGGIPAILSPELVGQAHGQGFLTVTDDLSVQALAEAIGGTASEVVRRAFLAGNDVLLTTEPIDWDKALNYRKIVLDLLKEKPELSARLDQSVLRVLRVKAHAGLLTGDALVRAKQKASETTPTSTQPSTSAPGLEVVRAASSATGPSAPTEGTPPK